jgi:hypothetical protein
MNKQQAIKELNSLLSELENATGRRPSEGLRTFLSKLENSSFTISSKSTGKARRQKAPALRRGSRKDPEAVAQTIAELSARLKANFASDESFEQGVKALESSGLTKANVVKVYNAVFDTEKSFPKSVTKAALLNALRKDRIARVRAAS